MERRELIEKIEAMGYNRVRDAKHGTLYRHQHTGETVSVPHTPSENRSLKNTYAEAQRAAGKQDLAATAGTAALGFLQSRDAPMPAGEIAELIMSEIGCTYGAVTVALSQLASGKNAVVRVKRGWYVHDEELAELPPVALQSALEYLNGKNPASAWADVCTRREMLAYGCDIARVKTKMDLHSEGSGEPDSVEPAEADAEVAKEFRKALGSQRLFELLAVQHHGADSSGYAVLREDDGTIFVAERLIRLSKI